MALNKQIRRMPAITVTRSDHERLFRLADTHTARNPQAAEALMAELDRARIVRDGAIRDDIVRMGSTLRFASDRGEDRTLTLVFPGEADIAAGKVSILTPIGAALIGLSVGQSIDWTGLDGRVHRLTVEMVKVLAGSSAPASASVELRSVS